MTEEKGFRGGFYNTDHTLTLQQYSLCSAHDQLYKFPPHFNFNERFPKRKYDIVISSLQEQDYVKINLEIQNLFPHLNIYDPSIDVDITLEEALKNTCMLIFYTDVSKELDIPENLENIYLFTYFLRCNKENEYKRIININPSRFNFPDIDLLNRVNSTEDAIQELSQNIDRFPPRDYDLTLP